MFLFAILLMQAFMYKDPVADQLIRAAMQANYDLKIDETHELTRRLQQTYPDHPLDICSPQKVGGNRRPIPATEKSTRSIKPHRNQPLN
jgi:hypothetical protein